MLTHRVVGVAKVVPAFKCRCCNTVAPGDGTLQVRFGSEQELYRLLQELTAPRNFIPVGWASDGVHGVRCNACVEQGRY